MASGWATSGRRGIRRALRRALLPGPSRLEILGPTRRNPARVGLVPGSFDPMTVAHAALAAALLRDGCEVVLLVYSPRTLAKEEGPGGAVTPPLLREEDRVASAVAHARTTRGLRAAIASHGLIADQAEAAARAFPHAHLTFGVGSDKILQILDPAWYEDRDAALGRLFGAAEIAYGLREGDEDRVARALAGESRWVGRVRALELPPEVAWVSSRAVRDVHRRGGDVADLVPPAVRPFLDGPEPPP